MSKWINIIKEHNTGVKKTDTFLIQTKDGNQCIGLIKWYAPWRKYSFFPNRETVYETQCLKDIVAFIDKLMLDRKIEKQNKKQKS